MFAVYLHNNNIKTGGTIQMFLHCQKIAHVPTKEVANKKQVN